jgi:hypothetical protein
LSFIEVSDLCVLLFIMNGSMFAEGWGYGLEIKLLPGMYKVLCLIPRAAKQKPTNPQRKYSDSFFFFFLNCSTQPCSCDAGT